MNIFVVVSSNDLLAVEEAYNFRKVLMVEDYCNLEHSKTNFYHYALLELGAALCFIWPRGVFIPLIITFTIGQSEQSFLDLRK